MTDTLRTAGSVRYSRFSLMSTGESFTGDRVMAGAGASGTGLTPT
jgi:hypothetical protein